MKNEAITLDFETKDPYLDKKWGPGWAYMHIPHTEFKPLGCAFRYSDGSTEYITNMDKVVQTAKSYKIWICHNAQYDIGILYKMGVNLDEHTVIDTKILAHLSSNLLGDYSLGGLSIKFLKDHKDKNSLVEAAILSGLSGDTLKNNYLKNPVLHEALFTYKDPVRQYNLIVKKAYKNMDVLQENYLNLVAEYAIHDVTLTYNLSQLFKKSVTNSQIHFYSDLLKTCVKVRERGVRVDVDRIPAVKDELRGKLAEEMYKIESLSPSMAGVDTTVLGSTDQIYTAVKLLYPKMKIPHTSKGNPSFTKDWLEKQTKPFFKHLMKARKYNKYAGSELDKLQDIVEHTGGYVYSAFNILLARTGRFSSVGPNLQQVPKRDKELNTIIRKLYIPHKGDAYWGSTDWDGQEIRLQVHFSKIMDAPKVDKTIEMYNVNPKFDMHGSVAKLAGITRDQAKAINFGLSYGMGIDKLSADLNTTKAEAESLKEKYYSAVPYLKTLDTKCKRRAEAGMYIETLGGRRLQIDPDRPYTALNYLIQGSAADQMGKALIEAEKAGLNVLFGVHDELNISTNNLDDLKKLCYIMKTCVKLELSVEAEAKYGKNWGELTKLEE